MPHPRIRRRVVMSASPAQASTVVSTSYLLLDGDMQSGTDVLLLDGDLQSGTDKIKLDGDMA